MKNLSKTFFKRPTIITSELLNVMIDDNGEEFCFSKLNYILIQHSKPLIADELDFRENIPKYTLAKVKSPYLSAMSSHYSPFLSHGIKLEPTNNETFQQSFCFAKSYDKNHTTKEHSVDLFKFLDLFKFGILILKHEPSDLDNMDVQHFTPVISKEELHNEDNDFYVLFLQRKAKSIAE